jgi:hypothetical protein
MPYLRILLCTLLVTCCAASQPAPELGTNLPIAVKAGQTVEVTLSGTHLKTVQSVALSDASGVTANIVEAAKDDQVKLKFTTAKDVAVGERQFRLVGPNGVTRAFRILITPYEVRALTDADQAKEVTLPATVTGQVAVAGQSRQFQFHGRKNELLIFDVLARRSGSPLDAVVTVQNDAGRQLRATIERHSGDQAVMFTPPEDGTYTVRLRDLRFRGGADYNFCINAGRIPYLESVTPGSGKPGTVVKAKPVGYNLENAEGITIDLSHSAPGRISVHANTPLGVSNTIPFEVTDLPQIAESEPNDSPDEANLVQLPVEISAATDRPSDEDFFRFRLAYKQPVSLEVLAARLGSPMVPLLQLRDAKGNVIEANDGTTDSDGRIIRELDAGEYLASVRDLAYSGGPGHWYRLKIEPARSLQGDFSVRFNPDASRLHRGGSVAVWCDVRRTNGQRGDITLVPQSLPAGVTIAPLTLGENGNGWLTLSASADAPLGTTPLRIGAQAASGMGTVSHDSQSDAYLTVLDAAPFTVQTIANLSTQQIDETSARLAALSAKLAAPADARLEAAQAQWEKRVPKEPVWKPLEAASVSSAKGAKMLRLSDSSILVAGNSSDQDDYTVVAHTDLKGITAVRLEAIDDERLPGSGPGTAPNGNFVLSAFKLSVTKGSEAPQAVVFGRTTSDFAQENFPAAAAINPKPNGGWAIDPQEGRRHVAVFRIANPVTAGQGTTLTFVLSHASSFAKHNLGRFRLSVTTVESGVLNEFGDAPAGVLAAVAVPTDQRTGQQRSEITAYYRSIDPELAAMRRQVAALRSFVGPQAELQRLQTALTASTPQLDAGQKDWEKSVAAGGAWALLQAIDAKSDGGISLSREADGSVFAQGASASEETYRVTVSTPMKAVTGLRLEALPDPRLPGSGPGRGDGGGFSLTGIEVTQNGRDVGVKNDTTGDEKNLWTGTGGGLPAEATFRLNPPAAAGALTITLHQPAGRSIGRLRIWVTSNPKPEIAARIPDRIAAILKTPEAARNPGQKRQLGDYYRGISPSLMAMRDRVTELRAQVAQVPPQARRNQAATIPVLINRDGGFKGNVTVTLEGYASGNPRMIARQIKVTPLVLNGETQFGLLAFQPEPGADMATRMVVLKAETKMGDETITQYSPAFPLTVSN